MWLQALLATIMWGVAPMFERVYTKNVSLCTIGLVFAILILLCAPILLFFTRKTWMKEAPTLLTTNRHVISYGIGAFIVSVIAFSAYLAAIQHSNERTYVVVAVTCAYPLITALLLAFMKYNISPWDWIAIILIVVGIIILSLGAMKSIA
jgi:drug/metabolite transporter (DMT)-like permease